MKKVRLLLVMLWLIIIFLFSSSTGTQSNSKSKELINKGIIIYEKITNTNVDNKVIINKLNYPLRKLAHYTIFLILGIFVYLYVKSTKISNKVLISIIICLICASFDETHQIFTGGRTPKVLDVLIDTLGSITSIAFLYFKNRKIYN